MWRKHKRELTGGTWKCVPPFQRLTWGGAGHAVHTSGSLSIEAPLKSNSCTMTQSHLRPAVGSPTDRFRISQMCQRTAAVAQWLWCSPVEPKDVGSIPAAVVTFR